MTDDHRRAAVREPEPPSSPETPSSPEAPSSRCPALPPVVLTMASQSENGIYYLDGDGRLCWANPALLRMIDARDVSALDGRVFDDLWRRPADRRNFLRRLEAQEGIDGFERELMALDGAVVRVRESRHVHCDRGGRALGYLGILLEVATAAGNEAESPGTRDFATGAYGRDCLPRLEREMQRSDESWGCLVLTLDSPHGAVNSAVVRALSHLVTRVTRPDDVLVGLAADRLALFARVGTAASLKSIAERIAARAGRETGLRVAIGLAVHRPDEDLDAMLERAGAVPYVRAKVVPRHGSGVDGGGSAHLLRR